MHFKTDWKTYKRMYFKICFRIESRRDKAASVWPQGARRFGFQTKTPPLAAFSRRREARLGPRQPLGAPHKAASVWPQTKRIGARAFLGSSRLAPKRGIRRDDPAGHLTG